MYASSLASLDCVEQIVKEEEIACDFSRSGHLEVACKQKHFDNYERQAEIIEVEFNHKLRVVQRSELSAEIGSTIYFGGMVDEVSAGCNPARYVAGLARAAMKAGAEIYEHARVNGIERDSQQGEAGWKITTSRGSVWAHEVFVGTSGYTGAVTPELQRRIIPIGSFIITTEILPAGLAQELSPRNRMIYDSKNYLYYYRLTPDRRINWWLEGKLPPEKITYREGILCRRAVSELTHLSNIRAGRPANWPATYPKFWPTLLWMSLPWRPGMCYDDLWISDLRPGIAALRNWFQVRAKGSS
jgi:glycine/D-amino acid oxidase-like deaminating enzyme